MQTYLLLKTKNIIRKTLGKINPMFILNFFVPSSKLTIRNIFEIQSSTRDVLLQESYAVQVNTLLLHPLFLEVQPVYLRSAPFRLQVVVGLEGIVDAVFNFLKPLSDLLFVVFQLLQLLLHLKDFVVQKIDLFILVLDEGCKGQVFLGANVQFYLEFLILVVFSLDGVSQIRNEILFLAGVTEHQILLYFAQLSFQQLVLFLQNLIFFLDVLQRTFVQLGQGFIGPEATIELDIFVANCALSVEILLIFVGRSLGQDIFEGGPNGHKVIIAHPRFLDTWRQIRSVVEVRHIFVLDWRYILVLFSHLLLDRTGFCCSLATCATVGLL